LKAYSASTKVFCSERKEFKVSIVFDANRCRGKGIVSARSCSASISPSNFEGNINKEPSKISEDDRGVGAPKYCKICAEIREKSKCF
jgi:hypothetical protein